ncbi:MAG: M28 family peptidase [Pseudoflavonifractor sp.]|nr:M28 family peptidase [Pseudoflavonifractor sp.]
MTRLRNLLILSLLAGAVSCGGRQSKAGDVATPADSIAPTMMTDVVFDGDSAYSYVERQVNFGPRIPGTVGHDKCQDFILAELRRHGADTILQQRTTLEIHTGRIYAINNIMGRFNPQAKRRVMLVAHYDTRPWADNDNVRANRDKPVPGANDGASGVGVLLEIARQIGKKTPDVGVDMLFVDAEDSGESASWGAATETWALGTQYWTKHMPYTPGDFPSYAILLDMVGAKGAKFHREYFSDQYAPEVLDRVWGVAARSGYGERFPNIRSGAVTDDHYFINQAGIPAIDIIECDNPETKNFHPSWHTTHDDMSVIDRSTLKAVGQTVVNTIYTEPAQ